MNDDAWEHALQNGIGIVARRATLRLERLGINKYLLYVGVENKYKVSPIYKSFLTFFRFLHPMTLM